jgi:aryl-alcohol dehydrogenase-like predicted oxidoreductase
VQLQNVLERSIAKEKIAMRYQIFGNTGLKVSELCLGAMTFGDDWGWGSSREESRAVFDAFVEAGGNFIDTADVYTGGTSEKLLGEFIANERDSYVVATKFTAGPQAGDPNAAGNSRKNMRRCLEGSLRRLGTDYVDVYWVHVWDFLTPIEEVMQSFDDLVREGKVLYVGISDAPAWVLARAQTLAEQQGTTRLAAMQILYSLSERGVEGEFLPMAEALDLAVCCWSPLDQGLLTGKFTKGSAAGSDSLRSNLHGGSVPEAKAAIIAEVENVATELGASPAQVALRWLRQRSPRAIPVIGARTTAQLSDNLGAVDLVIPNELYDRLEITSRRPLAWPHEMYSSPAQSGFTYGGFLDRIDSERPFPVRKGSAEGIQSYTRSDD